MTKEAVKSREQAQFVSLDGLVPKTESSGLLTAEEVNSNLGITDDDLADYDEVEID